MIVILYAFVAQVLRVLLSFSCSAWPLPTPLDPLAQHTAAAISRPAPANKVLGVDYGSKWTGLATGIHTTCNPLQV